MTYYNMDIAAQASVWKRVVSERDFSNGFSSRLIIIFCCWPRVQIASSNITFSVVFFFTVTDLLFLFLSPRLNVFALFVRHDEHATAVAIDNTIIYVTITLQSQTEIPIAVLINFARANRSLWKVFLLATTLRWQGGMRETKVSTRATSIRSSTVILE